MQGKHLWAQRALRIQLIGVHACERDDASMPGFFKILSSNRASKSDDRECGWRIGQHSRNHGREARWPHLGGVKV